jgi:Ca2+-binding EF-hand superfamily protein
MSKWDMTEMDSNQDNMLSLEEYSDRYRKSLSKSFNMIDINQDGMVDEGEWTKILEVHGGMTD